MYTVLDYQKCFFGMIVKTSTTQLHQQLNYIINQMSRATSSFVVSPSANFTRNRVFTFLNTLKCIIGMAGNSLNKELYDFFKKQT